MFTDDGHKMNFSEEEDKHECGADFLVHMDMASAVLRC